VQNIIETGESYVKNAVFESLLQESIELTKDKFGNYVFQKIFERGSQEHGLRLLEVVKQRILEFSENCYGCRVVQKAIEFTVGQPQEQKQIMHLLEPYTLYLIENINGNHVMQKCFEVVDLPVLDNAIQVVTQHVSLEVV
jgi:pumilio RNA-binding family